MKHNLILGWICMFLEIALVVYGLITGYAILTPLIIVVVAALYFAGRHMDRHHD